MTLSASSICFGSWLTCPKRKQWIYSVYLLLGALFIAATICFPGNILFKDYPEGRIWSFFIATLGLILSALGKQGWVVSLLIQSGYLVVPSSQDPFSLGGYLLLMSLAMTVNYLGWHEFFHVYERFFQKGVSSLTSSPHVVHVKDKHSLLEACEDLRNCREQTSNEKRELLEKTEALASQCENFILEKEVYKQEKEKLWEDLFNSRQELSKIHQELRVVSHQEKEKWVAIIEENKKHIEALLIEKADCEKALSESSVKVLEKEAECKEWRVALGDSLQQMGFLIEESSEWEERAQQDQMKLQELQEMIEKLHQEKEQASFEKKEYFEVMYLQLKKQFEEKSDVLSEARRNLFVLEGKVWLLERQLDEEQLEVCQNDLYNQVSNQSIYASERHFEASSDEYEYLVKSLFEEMCLLKERLSKYDVRNSILLNVPKA